MQNVVNLRSLVARLHESFNDRDLDAWSDVFDDEVELVVDGGAFRGVAAARPYVTAVFREFPGRLVHTIITLKLARRAVQNEREDAAALLTEALDNAEQAKDELRELAHGILPAVLTRGGLRAGVEALASRMPVPVENGVSVSRLPPTVEATAYFVVAEALTNIAKHARAECAAVTARVDDGTLVIHVRDDGVGGAQGNSSGLTGLTDRLAALDGELRVESPADSGTVIAVTIPLPG